MVVVSVDAHDARAVDGGVQDLGGFEVGGNEDAGVKTLLRGLCGHGVRQIAGGRTAHRLETKAARGHQRRANDTVLKRQRREAHRIVLEIDAVLRPQRSKRASAKRPAAYRQPRWKA